MSKFKVGDKVYCPIVGTEIYKLTENKTSPRLPPMLIEDETGSLFVRESGATCGWADAPIVFHATKENYELLSKLYPGVEFAKPPVPPTPREVITNMLDDGWAFVTCLVSDHNKDLVIKNGLTISAVNKVIPTHYAPYRTAAGAPWVYAQPIDVKTGKRIVDYVDGEVVLGD